MPKFRYDTQDLAVQVDVIRAHLRALYSRDGPPPADLAPDHDMLWPERESERLEHLAVADAAAAEAARKTEQRLKDVEGEKSARYRAALNTANAADAAAKQARINADAAKAELNKAE